MEVAAKAMVAMTRTAVRNLRCFLLDRAIAPYSLDRHCLRHFDFKCRLFTPGVKRPDARARRGRASAVRVRVAPVSIALVVERFGMRVNSPAILAV
jgi:hypothetical protein